MSKLRVGYSRNFGMFPVDPVVSELVERALRTVEPVVGTVEILDVDLGCSFEELFALHAAHARVSNASLAAEFKRSGLDLLADHEDELDEEFASTAREGAAITAVDYVALDVLRTRVLDWMDDIFRSCDILITPTVGVLPFDNATDGSTRGPSLANAEALEGRGWFLTTPMNLTGNPAASVPAGFTSDGLPVGMQVIGRRYDDTGVLAMSRALEEANPWSWAYDTLIEP